LVPDNSKLVIYVGINGGDPKPYIFDTGSPVFNALYNEAWWPGLPPDPTSINNAPSSSVTSPNGTPMNNAQFCLGGSNLNAGPDFYCRGYTGNLVEVPSLSFYAPLIDIANPTPVATLNASPGYVVNAAYNYGPGPTESPNQYGPPEFPPFVDPPPSAVGTPGYVDDLFFGTFGAGNFLRNTPLVINPEDGNRTDSNYWAGGVLGQTIVSGVTQGYVVAANGQKNPVSDVNGPQQVNGINVTVGGERKLLTPCSPCVTVGLTPEMLGQFWAATPTNLEDGEVPPGVIPWTVPTKAEKTNTPEEFQFQNPYGDNVGNNASGNLGQNAMYQTTLTPSDDNSPVISEQTTSMLDAGTPDLNLGTNASPEQAELVSKECLLSTTDTSAFDCKVEVGVTFTVVGVTPNGQAIPGLPTTTMVVTDNKTPDSEIYNASLTGGQPTNTIGLPFFLQNSMMYDLTHQVTGYTPFFVTDAALVTTVGGPLIVDGDNVPLGLAGRVSGAGGVTIRHGGAVQLSAKNTYTGPTEVFDGAKLFVSGPGSIEASSGVRNEGVFDISRAWHSVSIQALTGSGDTYLGGQNLVVTNAAGTFSGTISDGWFSGTLHDSVSYLGFPGTGGGLTLTGGVLTLSGANTYTGLTWVNQGALIVNGSVVSPVAVTLGGLLGGSGSVGATAIGPGGVLAPGNSIGTMTVNGNLTLNPDAIYEVEANAQDKSDKVIVEGIVNLTGATLFVLDAPGAYKPKTDYVIINNDGTDAVNGRFGEVINTLAFLDPSVTYNGGDGNDVVLTLERISFGSVAKTPNHTAVAGVLDQFPTDDALFLTVLNQTEQSARQAFDALSGEIHATVAGTLADDSRYVREAVLGRLMQASHAGQSLAAGGPQVALIDSQAMRLGDGASLYDGKSLIEPAPTPLAFWTRAFGAWGDFDTDSNAASADRDLGGFISGMDANIGGSWRVGLATGASFSNVAVDARYSSVDVETYHLGGYFGGMAGAFALRSGGMWAWNDIETSRAVVFPGFYERQTASYDADTGQLFGEVAYPTQMSGIALEPFGGLAFVSIDTDSFRERGGALASLRGDADQDVGYFTVGLRAATTMHWGAMLVTPHLSAAWQHAFDDVTPDAMLAFASTGIGFTVYGVPLAEDSALIDAGLDFALGKRTTAGVSYSGQFGDGVTDNGVKGRFIWLF
jgi:outer membrane autotransporter protein